MRIPALYVISALFFFSGMTGLVLQVIWMYRLGLIFGNAAYATAVTLTAFFLGLALGGRWIGQISGRMKRPLLVYAILELGIAASALLFLYGVNFYESLYPALASLANGDNTILLFIKFIFSIFLLIIPSTLMGGTFPILSQFVAKEKYNLAHRGTILYAFNTIGAAVGAFLAGFYWLSTYGVMNTYLVASSIAACIGIMAYLLDMFIVKNYNKLENKKGLTSSKDQSESDTSSLLSISNFSILAFSSGVLALSAEILWTRMFAQVLQNSVYSFSVILVVFLLALGLGGILSNRLINLSFHPKHILIILLTASAAGMAISSHIFNWSTDGLDYFSPGLSWMKYIWAVFKLCFSVVFIPTVILGAIFPYLLKLAPFGLTSSGRIVGRLVFNNALGSAIGPIMIGFVFLNFLGLWGSIKLVAIAYCLLSLLMAMSLSRKKSSWLLPGVVVALFIILLSSPPVVQLDKGERISKLWQSSDGVVSIVKSESNLQLRLDNFYVLGDSKSVRLEQMQAQIPLLLHPKPDDVLFLGMGTGITAGTALKHDVKRVVVVELIPNVIRAAKRYFSEWCNGLFADKRVQIIADDARNYLLGTPDQYDVIVGDLFTPWQSGTGGLYTVEHFEQVKEKLAPGGIFAQWLPMYQLTPESFKIIAATFTSVFPQVTLWRADFSGSRSNIALIGQEQGSQLDQALLQSKVVTNNKSPNVKADHMTGLFYLGNMKALKSQLKKVPLNNDDTRVIEFMAPILSQKANSGQDTYIVNGTLNEILRTLNTNLPPDRDPYLSMLPESELRYVQVGYLYFQYLLAKSTNNTTQAQVIMDEIHSRAPNFMKDTR